MMVEVHFCLKTIPFFFFLPFLAPQFNSCLKNFSDQRWLVAYLPSMKTPHFLKLSVRKGNSAQENVKKKNIK